MSTTLSLLVDNSFGVLTRITGLVARRGFNIESLAVSRAEGYAKSRITLVVNAKEDAVEQVTKQLHKLINVHKITDLSKVASAQRELVLFKVKADAEKRHELIEIASVFRAKVVDISPSHLIIEATGDTGKLNALEDLLMPYGIIEIARTGKVALAR